MTKREDMEKAFPPVLSDFNFVVVAGYGPVEKCRARGQQAAASGALLVQCIFMLHKMAKFLSATLFIKRDIASFHWVIGNQYIFFFYYFHRNQYISSSSNNINSHRKDRNSSWIYKQKEYTTTTQYNERKQYPE